MELKSYQKQVIQDLRTYLEYIERFWDYGEAYNQYWKDKWIRVDDLDPKALPSYKNTIKQCPHVCTKVPTAWWKTFIACNALRTIFDFYPALKEQVVVWLVPSRTILDQTYENLKNPDHPYRQKIETHFNGRVEVLSKDDLIQWRWFNASSVKEQLTICVLSFDTFRSRRKDDRKIYQENGTLATWFVEYSGKDVQVEWSDETSLMHILNILNPVVVVDESHNAQTDLSIEMLTNLNPSFILDITATPREKSNIVSYVSPLELKQNNMVKLPVLVYNMHSKTDVIINAINLQKNLEKQAIEEEKKWGKYIRPIVLFQAEPRSSKDTETFEKIKNKLIKAKIPEDQIAIKTADINEIKQWDLMSKDCPIRYIITVNALKEWWDCPFAYILASLANRSSHVDVTQILGRILRLPFVQQHASEFLNISYVFTASSSFNDTLKSIVEWLNNAWFSKLTDRKESDIDNDFVRAVDTTENDPKDLFADTSDDSDDYAEWIDEDRLGDELTTWDSDAFLDKIADDAKSSIQGLEEQIKLQEAEWWLWDSDIASRIAKYMVKDLYKDDVTPLQLPQFFLKVPNQWLFSEWDWLLPLERENLNEWFNLSSADTDISFQDVSVDVFQVDIKKKNEDYVPQYERSNQKIKSMFLQYLEWQSEEKQLQILANYVMWEIKRLDDIDHKQLKKYVERVLAWLWTDKLQDIKQNPHIYALKIKIKVKQLLDDHRANQFQKRMDQWKIEQKKYYKLPKHISPSEITPWVSKWLYTEEAKMNGFEEEVMLQFSSYENVAWRHKIIERQWFRINGFINHYPDFIIKLKNGKILIVETKWDDRDNSDSKKKLKLWKLRANAAWPNYSYIMVFNENPIDWAYTKAKFFEMLGEM